MPKAKAPPTAPKGKIGSIEAYLAKQPPEVRPILAKVVAAIQKAVPQALPTIAYQMPTWKLNGTAVLHLGAWKSHWSLYPATAAVLASLGEAQGSYEVEKGTLRFPLSAKVPVALIAKIAKARAAELTSSPEKNLLKRSASGGRPGPGKKASATKKAGATKKASAVKVSAVKAGAIPSAVGRPALRALEAAGITTLAEAARRNPMDLAKLHGVGPKALGVLAEAISGRRRRA